jgi:hypothetical protein
MYRSPTRVRSPFSSYQDIIKSTLFKGKIKKKKKFEIDFDELEKIHDEIEDNMKERYKDIISMNIELSDNNYNYDDLIEN